MADSSEFKALIEPLARHFFGEPNRRLSSKNELRFGSNGSLSIDIEQGVFFDHESSQGGGALDLVARQTGLDGADRIQYLETHGFRLNGGGDERPRRIVAVYDYCDEQGALLFQVIRYEPKEFRQRRQDPLKRGEWLWSVKGVRQVPYRLPELKEAIAARRLILIVEGEKDVDRLIAAGASATCNAGGAGKWRPDLNSYFGGADAAVIADNDPQATDKSTGELLWHEDGRPRLPGFDHAHDVAAKLKGYVASLKVLDLGKAWPNCPSKGDVSDFLAVSTLEALERLIAAAPAWDQSQASAREGSEPRGQPVGQDEADAPQWKRPAFVISDAELAQAFNGDAFKFSGPRSKWRTWT